MGSKFQKVFIKVFFGKRMSREEQDKDGIGGQGIEIKEGLEEERKERKENFLLGKGGQDLKNFIHP